MFFFLLCSGTLFLSSSSFVNAWIDPKKYAFIFCFCSILVTSALFYIFSDVKKIKLNNIVFSVCLIISILSLLQALYGIAQFIRLFPSFGGFKVTGSYDNPAGFAACLSVAFPFLFYFLKRKEIWARIVSVSGMVAIVVAVFLSGSRAGMLAVAVVCIISFFYFFRINTKQKIVLGIFIAILIAGLYFYKKNSADGRLLIWRCSWEMIKDKPLLGHGTGGFKANYMKYQAIYFKEHLNTKQAMLAGNINRPFNEYIGLLVNYGLVGFLLFLLLVFYLIRSFRRIPKKSLLSYIAVWSLAAMAVFALFSYPFRYPFVWVTGLLSISVIVLQGDNGFLQNFHTISLQRRPVKPFGNFSTMNGFALLKIMVPVLLLFIVPVVCYKSYNNLTAEMKWCRIAHKSLAGKAEQMLPEYEKLHSKLKNNELFLYNYAAELNFTKHYEKSLTIAQECERLLADYDLQMLIADNYRQLNEYEKAEQHYRKAVAMCPAKFAPLYELAKMYDSTGRSIIAVELARKIVEKTIKIPSPIIVAIQNEMRQLIERVEKNDLIPEKVTKYPHQCIRQGYSPNVQSSGDALPP